MDSDKIFKFSFAASMVIHTAILFQNPNFNLFPNAQKENKLELSYIKPPENEVRTKADKEPPLAIKNDPFLKLTPKVSLNSKSPPPYIGKDALAEAAKAPTRQMQVAKPAFAKPDVISIKKKISFPSVKPVDDINKLNNPTYINYYQMVREKIRRAAYQNYTHNQTGEAYLSFIIANDGHIKEVRLADEKSAADSYLKDVALRSVRDASPFPSFPKELDYQELSFNVIISFEIE